MMAIPQFDSLPIIEVGGETHYSLEFRVYLMSLPFEQRKRIVEDIEYRNRRRRLIDWAGLRRRQITIYRETD